MDDWGPLSLSYLGFTYCLVGLDNIGKTVTVFPSLQMNTDMAIHFIQLTNNIFLNHDKIMTDSSPYFTSKRFKKWGYDNNIQFHITTPDHSNANG
jgi:hypothetical protein